MTEAHIAQARKNYHADLLRSVLTINKNGVPTNADKDSKLSVRIAQGIAEQLESTTGERLAGQTSGSEFELINAQFLTNTFMRLEHMRPRKWEIKRIGNRNRMAIAAFEQYEHLIALERAAKYDPGLAAALGSDYTITPDVIIIQHLLSDGEINSPFPVVDDTVSRHAAIRESNGGNPLLHASISSKWTIRSDRSQNSRSEALNLIRNRKGHLQGVVGAEKVGERTPSS